MSGPKEEAPQEIIAAQDREIDPMEVARCSCGLVFYSSAYALEHDCLSEHNDSFAIP